MDSLKVNLNSMSKNCPVGSDYDHAAPWNQNMERREKITVVIEAFREVTSVLPEDYTIEEAKESIKPVLEELENEGWTIGESYIQI